MPAGKVGDGQSSRYDSSGSTVVSIAHHSAAAVVKAETTFAHRRTENSNVSSTDHNYLSWRCQQPHGITCVVRQNKPVAYSQPSATPVAYFYILVCHK